ncbi:MAG: c-type cytochrome [Candidatus Binatia bacterium]
MARRDLNPAEEQRSYSAIFLLAVGLLLAGAVWSVWDDNIARRPWKYYQVEFSERQQDQVREQIKAEDARLAADPTYQELTKKLAAARQRLKSGKTARRLATLEAERSRVHEQHGDNDMALRIVKSRLEEAWYDYDSAILAHAPTAAARQRVEELGKEKAAAQQKFDASKAHLAQIDKELEEVRSEVTTFDEKLKRLTAKRDDLQQKLVNMSLAVGPFRLPKIPKIRQVVLEDFDRNNFDKSVARVDRCESCHAGINVAGFENAPDPYKTHPYRKEILGKHPPEKFGCTPCHLGQGAAVNSPAEAHGEVPHWDEPLLRGSKVQASCLKCHVNIAHLPHAGTAARGEKLFEELGCHGCHLAVGYENLRQVGPYLRLIRAKVDPSWLVRWVTNPHQFHPKTRMPNFMFKPAQAQAIAAYLWDATRVDSEKWLAKHPAPAGIDPSDPVLVARGKELVDSVGCRGCHGFAEGESPALLGKNKDIAPNLSHVAEKTGARWIYYWIKGPRDYSPVARMPSLRLSDDEARAIVSFLLTLGEKHQTEGLAARLRQPEQIARGKSLIRKYGCFGCHDIPGMENESRIGVELSSFGSKPLDRLFFGDHTDIPHTWDDWTYNKLKTPRTYATERIEQLMPQFDLADTDIRALRVFLASRTDLMYPVKFHVANSLRGRREVAGRRLVARYNCVGCHIIEGQGGAIRARYRDTPTLAPPILNGEGAKVQPDWLFNFLKQPVPIRPWLKVRMPTFGLSDAEANTLVQYFGALADIQVPFVHIDPRRIPVAHLAAGRKLMSEDYFNCFSCHQQGARKPEGPPEGWAPDLTMARHRLNPQWIIRWLHNPQAVQPGTKMPSFYPDGPEDILGGDDDTQIEALRDYLMVLDQADVLLAQNRPADIPEPQGESVAVPNAN